MAQPRASRKKKPVVVSSSDQDEEYSPPPKRAKRGSTLMTASTIETRKDAKPATARKRRISPSSPSSTTSSKRAATKSPAKPKPSFKPITSFFHKAPLQPQSNHPTPSPEKSGASTPRVHVDDIIDSSDDDDRPVQPTKRQTSLPLRKGKDVVSTSADTLPKNSQKFRRTRPGASEPGVDGRPWNERFGPSSTSELAVHKKKVEAVRDWLAGVLGGKERKRLLLLKGPAGSGKTTTLSLVSKEMGIHVHEWKNPTSSLPSSDGLRSATAQFEEFVGRTGAFGSLAFEGNGQSHQQVTPSTQSGRQKQLVLVEEFPNTFTRGSSIIQSFRSSVLNYLAAATPSATSFFAGKANDQPITPVVMIISETLLSTNTASADSFTAHRLLGPDILTHQSVTVVDFNPIAPTFMTKALDLVISKEARKSGRTKTVGPQVIQHLTELGDIRSAISSLEFLCLRGDEGDYSAKIQPSKAKKQKDIAMTKMEQDSLLMVTQRESTLGIFHAVGRVVYNKRLPSNPSEPVPQPPPYFPDRRRPQAPEADADALINELGTDTDTFVAALHENYVLSTDAGDSEETLDCINGCIDALSDADLLSPDRFGRSGRNVQGSGADNLRQDEMSFQTSVRGLLYSLPNPVKRIAPPPGVKGTRAKSVNGAGTDRGATNGSAFVMYYPASLRLWRQQEETNGLLEMWISRAQRDDLLVPSTTTSTPSVAGGVDTWRKTTTPFSKPTSSAPPSSSPDTPSPILLGSGTSARTEMLLERLPYLTRILSQHTKPIPRHRSHHQPLSSPSPAITTVIREIQKITTFHGPAAPLGDDEDVNGAGDEVAAALSDAEQWTTDRPGYATPRKKKKAGVWAKKDGGDVGMESAVPGTAGAKEDGGAGGVLSDDDIED